MKQISERKHNGTSEKNQQSKRADRALGLSFFKSVEAVFVIVPVASCLPSS